VSSGSELDSDFGSVSMSSPSSYSGICIRLSDDDGGIYPVIISISCLSFRHLIIKVLPLHFKLKIFFASLAAISYNNNSVFLMIVVLVVASLHRLTELGKALEPVLLAAAIFSMSFMSSTVFKDKKPRSFEEFLR
jgi:hypothetical protein